MIDRYLVRELLVPLTYCLTGFLVFWISSDLLSELSSFSKGDADFYGIAVYYLYKIPEFLSIVMPVGLLLAMLYTITNHARHNELIAIRAAGVSYWRLCLPYLVTGAILGCCLFVISEFIVPRATELSQSVIKEDESRGYSPWHTNITFINRPERRVWNISAYNVETHEMIRPKIDWKQTPTKSVQIQAQNADFTNGYWQFNDVRMFTYNPLTNDFPVPSTEDVLVLEQITETPEQIKSEIKISGIDDLDEEMRPELSMREIFNYLKLHPNSNSQQIRYLQAQLHGKISSPLTCIVVVLISLPFGTLTGRRNAFVGVASSILICFIYFVVLKFGMALGVGGLIPSWLGAWMPNALFGAIGIIFTQRMQ